MRRLFSRILDCPLGEMVGRSGQDQEGLDIIGRRPTGTRGYFGIQCKLKEELGNNRSLRRKTLEAEVAEADKIEPRLSEFVFATTAANDIELQNHARALTAAREASDHPLDIQVIGWTQLRAMIGEHRDILDSYLGIEGVADLAQQGADQHAETMAALAAGKEELKDLMGALLASQSLAAPFVPPLIKTDDPRLSRAIDRIKAKLERDDVRGALTDLETLRDDEWEEAGPNQRFRILGNLGSAYWRLGDFEEAEKLFRQASEIQPDDPSGLANLASAATCAGDPAVGLRAAKRLLELEPDSPTALLPLIQAQEKIAPIADPMQSVPAHLRDSEEAIVGTAQVLRNRNDDSWITLSQRGVDLHPDSELLARLHADATLARMAAVDGSHVGAKGEAVPTHDEIEAAVETLEKAWARIRAVDPSHPDLSIPYNLANALRGLGRNREALTVLEQAEHYSPEKGQIAHLHAILLATLDQTDAAIALLRQHTDNPESLLLLCNMLEASPADVHSLLSAVAMPAGSRQEMWQRVLDAEARAALDPSIDISDELESAASAFPASLVPLTALAKRAQTPEERQAIGDRMLVASGAETSFTDILSAALWMRGANLPAHVLALLDSRTSRSEDSTPLRWLIEALYALDDRAALLAELDALPPHVGDTPRFLYFRQVAAYRAGDMPGALEAVEQRIACDPEDLAIRLEWLQILHRWQLRETMDAWLAGDVEALEGRVEQRADLALILANHGLYDRARRLAYRVARLNPDNRHALERFTGVMMNPAPSGTSELGLSRVGPDAVFTIVEDGGGERTYRLDDERDLPAEAIDLAEESPIALAAQGLGKGDTFELPAALAGLPPRTFKITGVLHKHIHYFRWLSDVLPDRFGGPQVIYKMTVNPEDLSSLNPLIDHLRERETQAQAVNDDYREHARPLRIIAAIHGRSVIDTYDGLGELSEGAFHCSDGGGPEFDHEIAALKANRRRGCVVDTITIEIIRRHDLWKPVRAVAGPISIAQGTLDDFIERADKGELLVGRYQGNLTQRDGHLVADRVHPAHITAAVEVRQSALEWLGSAATVVPAIGPQGLARQLASMLPDELGGQFQDEVLVAAQSGQLLLSEDLGYRRFAGSAGIRLRAGLAALLRLALARGMIAEERYVETMSAFGRANHRFVAVSAEDMAAALALDSNVVGTTLRGVAALIGGPGSNVTAQWKAVSEFLAAVWQDDELVAQRHALATLMADRLLSDAPDARRSFSAALFRDPDNALTALDRAISGLALADARSSRAG